MEHKRTVVALVEVLWILIILTIAGQALLSYRAILNKWERVEVPEVIEYPATITFNYEIKKGFLVLYLKIFFPRGIKADKYCVELRLQDSNGRPMFSVKYESFAFQGEYVERPFRIPLAQLNLFDEYELVVSLQYSNEPTLTKRFKIKLLHS